MLSISQELSSFIQSVQTSLKEKWNLLTPQQKIVAGIALTAFSAFVWISILYNLHKYIQSTTPTKEELKIIRSARPLLKLKRAPSDNPSSSAPIEANGKIYEGNFKIINGQIFGKGKAKSPSGDVEEGDFENGQLEGHGTRSETQNKCKFEGIFKNGIFTNGRKTFLDSTNNYVEGPYVNGKFNGKCKCMWNGVLFEGDFVGDYLNGEGKKTLPDGTILEGTFVRDKLHGEGTKTYPDGRVQKGLFNNDNYIP